MEYLLKRQLPRSLFFCFLKHIFHLVAIAEEVAVDMNRQKFTKQTGRLGFKNGSRQETC